LQAPSSPDRIAYFAADGVDCLAATLGRYRYALHSHASFVIGAIASGTGSITVSGQRFLVEPGDLTLYNPHEVHDGGAEAGNFAYRVCYPGDARLQAMAAEMPQHGRGRALRFRSPVVRDPAGARLYLAAHQAWQRDSHSMQAEEGMSAVLEYCLVQHAGMAALPANGAEPQGLARAIDCMHARLGDALSLAELVRCSGIPRQRLIHAFRHATGFTPHAYLLNLRVGKAKELLRAGADAATVAMSLGFSDQAHLTRAFKARVGVPPALFRTAVQGRAHGRSLQRQPAGTDR
jgi:AraC-like DNA-binding protein